MDGQIGLEDRPDEYVTELANLLTGYGERVMKPQGSLWLNLGDTYAASGTRGSGYTHSGSLEGRSMDAVGGFDSSARADFPAKCLLMIPERVALALIDRGWILRNKVVWAKPNGMPSSVQDRLATKWEFLFHLVRAEKRGQQDGTVRWMSDTERAWLAALIDGEGTIGIRRDKHNDRLRTAPYLHVASSTPRLLDRIVQITGVGEVQSREYPNAPDHFRQMFQWRVSTRTAALVIGQVYPHLIAKQEQAKVALTLQQRLWRHGETRKAVTPAEEQERERLHQLCKALNQWEASESGLPEPNGGWGRWFYGGAQRYHYDLDAIRVEPNAHSVKYSGSSGPGPQWADRAKANMGGGNPGGTTHPDGANPGDVWTIATQPYPEAHFAVYPPELIRRPILATVPEGGTVLDPFFGSGTTGVMARRLGRKAVGVELNADYCALAADRFKQGTLLGGAA